MSILKPYGTALSFAVGYQSKDKKIEGVFAIFCFAFKQHVLLLLLMPEQPALRHSTLRVPEEALELLRTWEPVGETRSGDDTPKI